MATSKDKTKENDSHSEYPLSKNEEVLKEARVHNFIFAPPIFYALIALLLGVFFHKFIFVLVMFMNLYPIYFSTVYFLTTRLVLTNKKVMGKTGFLTRDWTQLKLSKIETAQLEEPIIGRMVGYSTVVVTGTGTGAIRFPFIINGGKFVRALESLLDEREE
jgi:uncharacterized membrane protein YdbT with pleckstrin-like domain